MSEVKCLRNMSCTCPMCAGEDLSFLQSLNKSIKSTISYADDENGNTENASMPPPPPSTFNKVQNSPPVNKPPRQSAVAVMKQKALEQRKLEQEQQMQIDTSRETLLAVDLSEIPHAAPMDIENELQQIKETQAETETDISVDTIITNITSSNWKLRKEGCEMVKALCERPNTRGSDIEPLLEYFPKMCDDSNASAMDAAFQAVLAYATKVEPFSKQIVPAVMKRLVEKGFAGRPGIVNTCEAIVQMFVEVGCAVETVEALLAGTTNKKPKVPPLCVSSMLEALKAFGPRVVPVTTIIGALPSLFESTVNGVRPLAMNLIVEIHRYIGPAPVESVVTNLRQAQKTEYEASTKDIAVGSAVPTKFVRGANKPKTSRVVASQSGSSAPVPMAIDPREFVEAVNLLDKLDKSEFNAKIKLPKWSEKVGALKIILEIIGPVPKLANGDYYPLISTLKLLINDSNVNIVATAIEVIGALSDGLRKNFQQYARILYPEIVRKLSDKKSVILNATNKTLDLILQHSMSIDMMLDEIKTTVDASKTKSAPARAQAIGFLARAVNQKYIDVTDKNLIVTFGKLYMAGMEDVDPGVRKAGLDSFIALLSVSNEVSNWCQDLLDTIAKKNPRSYKSITQNLGGNNSSTQNSTQPIPSTPQKPAMQQKSQLQSRPSSAGPMRPGSKPSEAAPKESAVSRKPNTAAKAVNSEGEYVAMAISVSPDDAQEIVQELAEESWETIQEGFAATSWLARKTAIEELGNIARQKADAMNMHNLEALSVFLSKNVKDFKDSNINVLKCAFETIGIFADMTATKFPRGVVCLVVPCAGDKFGDRKASAAIRTMLLQLCEATSPTYVLGCLLSHMETVKAPLAHIEVLVFLEECIKDFGVTSCSPRKIVDHTKGNLGLESSNPKVRSAAISVLGVMYKQLGPALLPILNLESWKPALASTVEAQFAKVGYDAATAMSTVTRKVKDDEDGDSPKQDPLALFGRVDVSAQITKELLSDMKCEEDKAAWKKRAAAMDSVQLICEGAGGAIELTKAVAELIRALKARLSDSNSNLKIKAAQMIGVVAKSCGPDIVKLTKHVAAALLGGVSDNKKNMQVAALGALTDWVKHGDTTSPACFEALVPYISEALLNPVGRAELLEWTAENLKQVEQSLSLDLHVMIVPTVQCLMDKSSSAREHAATVLGHVMKSVGRDAVMTKGCRDIKPAQMRSLTPIIQRAYESSMVNTQPIPQTTAPDPVARSDTLVCKSPKLPKASSLRMGSSQLTAQPSGRKTETPIPAESEMEIDNMDMPVALLKMSTTKPSRLAKGQYNKWIFDSTSLMEMKSRKLEIEADWRPVVSADLHAKLFAPSLEKGMLAAMLDLQTCVASSPDEVIGSLDLIFKWCTLRIVDNNVQGLSKLLELLVELFDMLNQYSYVLDDVEAAIILPFLLADCGQSKPRFRVRFMDVMRLVAGVYSAEKYTPYLMDCYTNCKNMKSRCDCIDMVAYLVENHGGVAVVGKRCVKEIAKFLDAHEKELRESALNALVVMYSRTGGDIERFFKFAGISSQKAIDLLIMRLKHLPSSDIRGDESITGPTAQSYMASNQFKQRQNLQYDHQQQQSMQFEQHQPQNIHYEQQQHNNYRYVPQPQHQQGIHYEEQQPQNSHYEQQQQYNYRYVQQHQQNVHYEEQQPQNIHYEQQQPQKILYEDQQPKNIHLEQQQQHHNYRYAQQQQQQNIHYEQQRPQMPEVEREIRHPDSSTYTNTKETMNVHSDSTESLLFGPIDAMLTDSKVIVPESSPALAQGIEALKALLTIIAHPTDASEIDFLQRHVSDIIVRLSDIINGSFCIDKTEKPLAKYVLSSALVTLSFMLKCEVAMEYVQRYAIERVLLEVCSKILDERLEGLSELASNSDLDISALSPEKQRNLYILKSLLKILGQVTAAVKTGELFPCVINLLQRILRNDVGEYNVRDVFNHLMKKDSLDQLVGRLLVKMSNEQANSPHPFSGVDIFGILMQMHSFFSTLPQNDFWTGKVASSNMQMSLRIIATSLLSYQRSSFEASLQDLPASSPVRELLQEMDLTSNANERGYSTQIRGEPMDVDEYGESIAQHDTIYDMGNGHGYDMGNGYGMDRNSVSKQRTTFDSGPLPNYRTSFSSAGQESSLQSNSAARMLRERVERIQRSNI